MQSREYYFWKYDISLMNLISAMCWLYLIDFKLFEKSIEVSAILIIHLIQATIHLVPQIQNKANSIQQWILVMFFIITTILAVLLQKSVNDQNYDSDQTQLNSQNILYTWQIESLIQLLLVLKLKYRMLLDIQRVIDTPFYAVILIILIQQILIAVLYTSTMLITTIPLVVYIGISYQYISYKLERKILLKEFNFYYINKLEKNVCIQYNYSSKKVQTQKQKILQNLNDITQSTSEKQEEYGSSNISSQQKKSGSIAQKSDIEANLNLNKENGDLGTKLKNKYQSNIRGFNAEPFKFKDEDISFFQNEFEQAKNKFNQEKKKQKSILNVIKEYFWHGRQVINRQLYKKYQSLQINSGIHRLKGSLHIINLPDNQEYGIILFKQSEQKIVDSYIQRIEQVQNQITLIIKELIYMTAYCSMPIPHSLDKSDIVIHQTKTHYGLADLNQDNGITNSNAIQPTKNQLDSPGTLASHSNIEIAPQVQKRQTVNHQFNYQSQSNFCFHHYNHSFTNINCLNDINPCISKTIQMQGNSFNAKHFFHNKNSINNKNITQMQQAQQQPQDICQQCASNQQSCMLQQLVKCRFQIQTILNDLREYQLSCLELQYPQYKKYKTKWISHETKQRENYENENQINHTAAYQQFQKDVLQQQQLIYFSNLANFAFLDIQVLDYIFSNDIQFQEFQANSKKCKGVYDSEFLANSKKCKGVYDSVINRIEDIYQQRTSITNLKILLDIFIKTISAGEKNLNISLEQFPYIDPGLLQEGEKQQFRQIYGDQLIEENSEKVAMNCMKTQTTGIFNQQQQGISNQTSPLISKTEGSNFLFQEEDLETYKDMILSIIQQICYLYKDNSSGIQMQVHRFYSKEGIFNPQLIFRKRYLKEVIKSYLILEQYKQNQRNNQNQIGNQQASQQFIGVAKYLNTQVCNQKSPQHIPQIRNSIFEKKQNEIQLPSISNIQHASSRIQPYKQNNHQNPSQHYEQFTNNQSAFDTPLKNYQQDSQENIDNIQQAKQLQVLNVTNKNQLMNQIPIQVSQAMSNSYQNAHQDKNNGNYNQNNIQPSIDRTQQQITGKYAQSMNDINQQSLIQSAIQNQEIKSNNNNNNNAQQLANDQSGIGSSREAQQIDNQYIEEIIEQEKYKKLKLVRVNIKIDQSKLNDELTSQISKETNCLTQIEEYVQYLSPLPLFYSRETIGATIIHTYSFYIQNYLYLNNLMNENDNQNHGSLMNLDQKIAQNNNQDIVSLDGQHLDQNQISQPIFVQKSTQNFREDNVTITQAAKEGQFKLNQQTIFQSSRQNFNDDHFQNRPSNTISFQQSHDNIEQATDRRFLQSHNNLQIRDQHLSFNGKFGGVCTQDQTFIENYPNNSENKAYSNVNINGVNDLSNVGFTDRQVEEPSAERRLSKNMEKLIAKQEYNASQNLLQLGDKQKQQKNIQNFDTSNKNIYHDEIDICIQDNIREREKSSDDFVNKVKDSKSLIKKNQVKENESQYSDLEYNKEVMDERDGKELTVILERSENNSYIINHYKNQLSKQASSRINDYAIYQNQYNSFLNQKSQFQSQLLPEDHKQTLNISKNIYGIESGMGSLIHPIVGSVSQNYIQQLNSNISKEGNLINLTSQYYDNKTNKEGNQTNYFSQNYDSKLKQSD